jgi:hypothetical protein
MRKQVKKGQKKGAQGKGKDSLATTTTRRKEYFFFHNEQLGKPAHLRRRLTAALAHDAVSGNPFAFAVSSGSVTTATEWAQLAPNYQQYRVRALRILIVPRNFNNMSFAATVWFPGTVVSARYPVGSSASGYVALWSEGGSTVHSCDDKRMTNMATMDDNPDAALWTDCIAGAPASLSQFGVQFSGTTNAPAIYNGVRTHDCFVEYDVEFLSRN